MSSPFQQKFSGKSPLKQGAYESAADNPVYVSNQPAMNAMQDAIAKVGVAAIKASNTPEKKAKRLSKRIKKRDERETKKLKDGTWIAPKEGSTETIPASAQDIADNKSLRGIAEGSGKFLEYNFLGGAHKSDPPGSTKVTKTTKATEGNKGYNKARSKTDKLQERLDSTLEKVESNKNNKKSKAFFCKGKAAGSHLDSYGKTVTCP